MSDDAKIDKVLEHILELKESMARLEGARLPDRVEKLEESAHENDRRWSKVAGVSIAAGALSGGLLGALAKKLGLTP